MLQTNIQPLPMKDVRI